MNVIIVIVICIIFLCFIDVGTTVDFKQIPTHKEINCIALAGTSRLGSRYLVQSNQ